MGASKRPQDFKEHVFSTHGPDTRRRAPPNVCKHPRGGGGDRGSQDLGSAVGDGRTRAACVGLMQARQKTKAWALLLPTLVCGQRCSFVSNDHGDALQEWLEATSEIDRPVVVLHVDAHNDLDVRAAAPAPL
jgi:hypothetical protein